MDNSLPGAMVQEVGIAPGHAVTPCEDVTELKQSFAGVLKYLGQMDSTLRQIETSLRKTEEQAGNTGVIETQVGNTGVTEALRTEFRNHVKSWDIESMIDMMRSNCQLMLETFSWAEDPEDNVFLLGRVSSIFQLAIILNSEEFVAKMLEIAPPEILNPFKVTLRQKALNDDFVVSPSELASVMHVGMGELLAKATVRGVGVSLSHNPLLAEKQDILDVLELIMSQNFEAFLQDDSSAERTTVTVGKTVREKLFEWAARDRIHFQSGLWWGTRFGISLGEDDNLFLLHFLAAHLVRCSHPEFELLKQVCKELGLTFTTRLLKLTDHHGDTPVHVCFSKSSGRSGTYFKDFIRVMKEYWDEDYSLLNVRNSAGMTILHVAVAEGQVEKVNALASIDGFEDLVDARFSGCKLTALHLAVIQNDTECVKQLMAGGCDLNRPSSIHVLNRPISEHRTEGEMVQGAFQLAATLGRVPILQALLKDDKLRDNGLIDRTYDSLRLEQLIDLDLDEREVEPPALHLACDSGNPLAVKTLLDSGRFDTFATDSYHGTALHYVADWAEVELHVQFTASFCGGNIEKLSEFMKSGTFDGGQKKKSIGTIIGCIELLMQAGLDMDQKNLRGQTPQLRTSAPDELTRWWYGKSAKRTHEAKENLVAASTAVSVTAALVATASFVGPLQPPLGLSTSADTWLTGYSQVNHSAIQVFLFCDGLSFYLAMASIMLASIPSLTIPREGLQLDVRIANRAVQISVVLLFASITFVICAFGAASIAIVPESPFQYRAVAVFTTIVGGLICFIALCLFVLRLMRLIGPNWKFVRNLHNVIFPLT